MRLVVISLACALAACSPAASGTSSSSTGASGTTGSGTSGGSTGSGAPDAQAQRLLDAQNQVRAGAQPAPSPSLPALTWSASAAQTAQAWAAGCRFAHNAGRGDLGENIAYFSPGGNAPEEVVQLWASEAADYDYASNSCAAGKACGHYTQLVWRDTTAVGCAVQHCAALQTGSGSVEADLWVCDYSPPGNYVGEKPY